MSNLSFEQWDELFAKLEFVLFYNDHVIITEDDKVSFSEYGKKIIHQFAEVCRESEWYKSTIEDLQRFWNGDNEFYVPTVENVYRVILDKYAHAEHEFLGLMAIVTHLPILDDCLNGSGHFPEV